MNMPTTKSSFLARIHGLLWIESFAISIYYVVTGDHQWIALALWVITLTTAASRLFSALKHGRRVSRVMPVNYAFKIKRVDASACGRYTVASGVNCLGDSIAIAIPERARSLDDCLIEGELFLDMTADEIVALTGKSSQFSCPVVCNPHNA